MRRATSLLIFLHQPVYVMHQPFQPHRAYTAYYFFFFGFAHPFFRCGGREDDFVPDAELRPLRGISSRFCFAVGRSPRFGRMRHSLPNPIKSSRPAF